jgi:hypothetical protein
MLVEVQQQRVVVSQPVYRRSGKVVVFFGVRRF